MCSPDESRPIKVAVVDDDEAVLDAVRLVMEQEGWIARTFTSGESFVASLQEFEPDCLILDPHLPGLSGAQVARAVAGNGYSIPVICLTARPDTPVTDEILDAGARAMLTKPVKADDLVAVVRASAATKPT
jgi:two-component system OmpR family response regulator